MNEIKCPQCENVFKVDEAGFSSIVKQVRDQQFEDELKGRLELAETEKVNAVKLAEANTRNTLQEEIVKKDRELAEVKAASKSELASNIADKELRMSEMKSQLDNAETEKLSAIKLAEANIRNGLQDEIAKRDKELAELKALSKGELASSIAEKDLEISQMKSQIENAVVEKANAIKLAEANTRNSLLDEIAKKDKELTEYKAQCELDHSHQLSAKATEITELKSKVDKAEVEKRLKVTESVRLIEKERDDLANQLGNKEMEKELLEKSLTEKYSNELKTKDDIIRMKDDEIALRKDMKLKLSTKMIGETLEHHCEAEFNKIRSAAFPNAFFGKDNDTSQGTKGDFIFRESDSSGIEVISIMFEMKNENDATLTKKKNSDFLAKLDKDRKDKNCEYAVLVTLLESENEMYNAGILDVSYEYPKMYVIRPQFFIPIITLLRSAAKGSMQYKKELAIIKNQNIDITNFEDSLEKFKSGFARNYDLASRKFGKAVDEIDKTIKNLEKVKENLLASENNYRLANKKADEVTIKRLTKGNPTMKAKFEELSVNEEE